jgi:antirestriction protein ArdC
MPWYHNGSAISRPTNVISERRYRGANGLARWIAAEAAGYASGVWGTYNQWREAGGQFRRDEKGTAVMLWKQVASDADGDDEDDETPVRRRIFARAFRVQHRPGRRVYAQARSRPRCIRVCGWFR